MPKPSLELYFQATEMEWSNKGFCSPCFRAEMDFIYAAPKDMEVCLCLTAVDFLKPLHCHHSSPTHPNYSDHMFSQLTNYGTFSLLEDT